MTPEDEEKVRRIITGANLFADDMKEQGIHVGMGSKPTTCVVDGELWPCQHVRNDHRGLA